MKDKDVIALTVQTAEVTKDQTIQIAQILEIVKNLVQIVNMQGDQIEELMKDE